MKPPKSLYIEVCVNILVMYNYYKADNNYTHGAKKMNFPGYPVEAILKA